MPLSSSKEIWGSKLPGNTQLEKGRQQQGMVAEIGVLWRERDGERERESVPEGHSEGEKNRFPLRLNLPLALWFFYRPHFIPVWTSLLRPAV
jgi:hypothetical protein